MTGVIYAVLAVGVVLTVVGITWRLIFWAHLLAEDKAREEQYAREAQEIHRRRQEDRA